MPVASSAESTNETWLRTERWSAVRDENGQFLASGFRSKDKIADEPVSRILCRTHSKRELRAAAIIPLVPASPLGSSSLPEGCSQRWIAPSPRERACLRKRSQRAGPALPSYLALHHAGFSVPPMLPPERWALTPPFHPCQTERAFRRRPAGFPARCHRASLGRRYILCGTFRSSAAPRRVEPGPTRRSV